MSGALERYGDHASGRLAWWAEEARARASRWAGPKDDNPVSLDRFDFTDAGAAVQRFAPRRCTPDLGVPARPGRIEFRPEPDDSAVLDQGSLDAHALRTIAASGLEAATQEEVDYWRWMPSPPESWRPACDPAGELVGLGVPAATTETRSSRPRPRRAGAPQSDQHGVLLKRHG
ncbi:hypothetical protein OG413_28925 [Streptomyces sp. NBC_01433]|uniref:hypothetical protein n=1 Tax=Streptomyces sp. NBC_01433 TaxID=2903864 RepID=UPI00224DD4CF|nr:hypothetical protein [Streptomyces sp. NBC_01433]MCX4679272.1 hypothetical protein [Streptomyces sp. NBC_01433]